MHDFELELDAALAALAAPSASLRRCSHDEAAGVIREAKRVFVPGNPRAWWMGLRPTAKVVWLEDDAVTRLPRLLPSRADRYWLIFETGQDLLPVVDVSHDLLVPLLDGLRFIEYYLVDPQYRWILCESDHHGVFVAEREQPEFQD